MSGNHTVEKIGGTSMSRFGEVMNNVIIGSRRGPELYNRIFVVSAYGGITNLLLEDKKTGAPGVYGYIARDSGAITISVSLMASGLSIIWRTRRSMLSARSRARASC